MKKVISLLFLLCPAICCIAQLPTIYASGGETKVNWDYREKQTIENEDEAPFLYGSGCTEGPSSSGESSSLSSQGSSNYYSSNLHDWNPRTAWVEGKTDYGIGEYFEVDLPYGGSNIGIFNGYQKNFEAWNNNSRVKKLKVYGDGKAICFVILADKMGVQRFDLPPNSDYSWYRFEIVDVFPGLKWKDVAISEICNYGCCFNVNTKILASASTLNAQELKEGSQITSVDPSTNNVSTNIIRKTAVVHHNQLIRISTATNSIELTSYHPIYLEEYGLTSLFQLKKTHVFTTYEEMMGQLKVLVWNNELQMCEYVPISNIEMLTGDFETYSIEELSNNKNYIINGFVTTTY
jgi:hypothetical protein